MSVIPQLTLLGFLPALLEVKSICVKIKDITIIEGLSFQADKGELIGVLGPNGSGKTTLLRAISGVLPFEGSVIFGEKPLSSWSKRNLASRVAVLQQNASIHFDFTVWDFVLLGRLPHKQWLQNTTQDDKQLLRDILGKLQLLPLKDRLVTTLSGGERQRVFLAQALTQTPELLILDEPTSNLDIYYQLDFLHHIRNLVDEGLTVIAVFHDIELAMRFADNLLILHNGRQAAFGPGNDIVDPTLLKTIFQVDATISHATNGLANIQYLKPL